MNIARIPKKATLKNPVTIYNNYVILNCNAMSNCDVILV